MGIVLVLRPYGLLGKPPAVQRSAGDLPPPLSPPRWQVAAAWIVLFLLLPLIADRYVTVLATDIACFALFAVSLHFIMGSAGMVSFGHAAYFGLGAYAAALLFKRAGLPMEMALVLAPFCAGLFAVIYGWFCVRLSGVYLAMLTLAFAQISWSIVFQWDEVTAGSNGIVGHLAVGVAQRQERLLLRDVRAVRRGHRAAVACAVLALRLRAARRPRLAFARRGDRHRRAFLPVDGLRAGGHAGWPRRGGLRLLQGQHLALGDFDRPVDGRAGHWCCWAASTP
jgi:hypothetical protein